MDQHSKAARIEAGKALFAEIANEIELASKHYGTTDLETIAALCGLPYDLLLRLRTVVLNMKSTPVDVDGSVAHEAPVSEGWLLSETEQRLIRAWREAASPNENELSISQDLAMELLKRRY